MARTRIRIEQILLNPLVPLNRRGCEIKSSLSIDEKRCWESTLIYNQSFTNVDIKESRAMLMEYGADAFCILRRLCDRVGSPLKELVDLTPSANQKKILDLFLVKGIIENNNEKYRLSNQKGTIGATFECFILEAVENLNLQSLREVLVEYPFPKQRFDPDGAKFDILSGLDLTKLLWIECKKPLYMPNGGNDLKNIINKDNIKKFYRRAWRLSPEIAIFLVDTKIDYVDMLKDIFGSEFAKDNFWHSRVENYDQIVMLLHNFIYFCRIDYKKNRDMFVSAQQALRQVLYDRRTNLTVIGPQKTFSDG